MVPATAIMVLGVAPFERPSVLAQRPASIRRFDMEERESEERRKVEEGLTGDSRWITAMALSFSCFSGEHKRPLHPVRMILQRI